jgi:hypothetical protein
MASATQVVATQSADLPEVGEFLHRQLAQRISAQAWRDSLTQRWHPDPPNLGTHLRHEGRVVGVFCAIYSEQLLRGQTLRVCNPHSWIVLEEFRSHSLGLLMPLLKQRDWHFTMLTPNPKVAQVFKGLRFRVVDDTVLHWPNTPSLRGGGAVATDPPGIRALLDDAQRRDFDAHAHLPWLRFVAFGRPGRACLVVYKTIRWKRLPCAAILHVGDAAAFAEHGHLLRRHLLGRGIPFSRVEGRFVAAPPPGAMRSQRIQPKLVLSPLLGDGDVRDLYSEVVALDI